MNTWYECWYTDETPSGRATDWLTFARKSDAVALAAQFAPDMVVYRCTQARRYVKAAGCHISDCTMPLSRVQVA